MPVLFNTGLRAFAFAYFINCLFQIHQVVQRQATIWKPSHQTGQWATKTVSWTCTTPAATKPSMTANTPPHGTILVPLLDIRILSIPTLTLSIPTTPWKTLRITILAMLTTKKSIIQTPSLVYQPFIRRHYPLLSSRSRKEVAILRPITLPACLQ